MDNYVPQSLDRNFRAQEIDIVFVLGCTERMNHHIHQVSRFRAVVERLYSNFDVHHAWVHYNGYPSPNNADYVVGHSRFTRELPGVVVPMYCQGSNIPDAMADSLYVASNLEFRSNAIKICVWIGDANLHGLHPMEELPEHHPGHRDLFHVCHQMAASGIVLLCVGCNQTTEHDRAFFMGLTLITGGRFIAARHVDRLPQIIARLVREEVENESLLNHAADHIEIARRANPNAGVDEIAANLHRVVPLGNARTRYMRYYRRDFAARNRARRISTVNTLPEAIGELRRPAEAEPMVIAGKQEIEPVLYVCVGLIKRALARMAVQEPANMPIAMEVE